jgi:hypothetical protein
MRAPVARARRPRSWLVPAPAWLGTVVVVVSAIQRRIAGRFYFITIMRCNYFDPPSPSSFR